MAEEAHYKFGIQMTCGGCSGAIERVLKRMEGDGMLADFFLRVVVLFDFAFLLLGCSSASGYFSTSREILWLLEIPPLVFLI